MVGGYHSHHPYSLVHENPVLECVCMVWPYPG